MSSLVLFAHQLREELPQRQPGIRGQFQKFLCLRDDRVLKGEILGDEAHKCASPFPLLFGTTTLSTGLIPAARRTHSAKNSPGPL